MAPHVKPAKTSDGKCMPRYNRVYPFSRVHDIMAQENKLFLTSREKNNACPMVLAE